MTEGYVPAEFADEVTPPPRQSPNDWIVTREGRFFLDGQEFYGDEFDEGEEAPDHELTHGAVTPFMRLETFPSSVLTVNDDKSWRVDPPPPAGAQQVAIEGDPETMDSSVENLVTNCELDADEYTLIFYTWHNEIWTFDATAKTFIRGAA